MTAGLAAGLAHVAPVSYAGTLRPQERLVEHFWSASLSEGGRREPWVMLELPHGGSGELW